MARCIPSSEEGFPYPDNTSPEMSVINIFLFFMSLNDVPLAVIIILISSGPLYLQLMLPPFPETSLR